MLTKLNVLIPEEINQLLTNLCKEKDRSKGYIVRKAINSYLEDKCNLEEL